MLVNWNFKRNFQNELSQFVVLCCRLQTCNLVLVFHRLERAIRTEVTGPMTLNWCLLKVTIAVDIFWEFVESFLLVLNACLFLLAYKIKEWLLVLTSGFGIVSVVGGHRKHWKKRKMLSLNNPKWMYLINLGWLIQSI